MVGKRGSEKYYILISLILGVAVLSLGMYFIFYEYFSEDDLNLEVCRESILVRNALPEDTLVAVVDISSKDYSPLKCETQVIDVDDSYTVPEFQRVFAESLISSWYLVGNGEYDYFPFSNDDDPSTRCLITTRIHVSSDDLEKELDGTSDVLKDALSMKLSTKQTYWQYIWGDGKMSEFGIPLNWNDSFEIIQGDYNIAERLAYGLYKTQNSKIVDIWEASLSDPFEISFPSDYDSSKGDIYVIISDPAGGSRDLTPIIVFVQEEDLNKLSEPFAGVTGSAEMINTKFKECFYDEETKSQKCYVPMRVCSSYETVPA